MGEILFLTHRVPWPPNRGDKIRSHHILRKLMELAPVHLVSFADDDSEAGEKSDIQTELATAKITVRTKPKLLAGFQAIAAAKPVSLTSFESAAISRYVHKIIEQRPIECIFIFSGQMAQYIPDGFPGRVVMDFADVDSAKFESYGAREAGPMGWINRREGRLLGAFEKQVARRANHSLFVSAAEAKLFQDRTETNRDKIVALGNGIDLEYYDPAENLSTLELEAGPLIIFTGQMDYRPNVEAVSSFAKQVMPDILKHHASAKFAIVGRAPGGKVRKLHGQNNTIVTGAVDDIRSWMKAADVVVAPLRIARGIQNKVLEAMAMEKPVVASTAAAEGIDADNGVHFLVASSAEQEAEMVCDLLADPERAADFGKRAGDLIRARYSWDQQLAALPLLCGFDPEKLVEAAE